MIDVWNAALKELEKMVNQDLMTTWFCTMYCIELTELKCVLEVDTDFRRDWVNSNYLDLITSAVQNATNSSLQVEVRSAEEKQRKLHEMPNEDVTVDYRRSEAAYRVSANSNPVASFERPPQSNLQVKQSPPLYSPSSPASLDTSALSHGDPQFVESQSKVGKNLFDKETNGLREISKDSPFRHKIDEPSDDSVATQSQTKQNNDSIRVTSVEPVSTSITDIFGPSPEPSPTQFRRPLTDFYEYDESLIPKVTYGTKQPIPEEEPIIAIEEVAKTFNLNPRYTFDSFVVGPSNQLIHSAANAVATKTKRYNPLFIYGNVGLGKTHLLHAIGNEALMHQPNLRIVCTSAEEFMNDMIAAINHREMNYFRSLYRDQCDLLLIDDIQFLVNKTSTQGEFFHTFNALHGMGKQIVLTCDTHPKELNGLDDRLTSRFAWGLSVDIQTPTFQTRCEIVKKKALQDNIVLPDNVAELLASSIRMNVRELEGALTYLEAQAALSEEPITLEYAKGMLNRIGFQSTPSLSSERIIETVSKYYEVTPKEITGRSRPRRISVPRQIAMYLARVLTDESFPEIGKAFGGKDHTTVMTAFRKFSKIIEKEEEPFYQEIQILKSRLSQAD